MVKLLIQGSVCPFRQLALGRVEQWLNVDLPRTQSRRVDLLGRMPGGRLLHIELQSTNDRLMPFRMAEYALAIMRRYGAYPTQLVLYVGNQKLRMKPEFRTEGMVCRYHQVDIRNLDGTALLESDRIEDNILAVLAGLEDSVQGIRSILARIAKLRKSLREPALQQLLLTCGIRGLSKVYEGELNSMPAIFDLAKEDELFASYLERGRRTGLEIGLEEGLKKGRVEGARHVVRLVLEKRFGRLPAPIVKRLDKLTDAQVQELAVAIVDARSLQELFGKSRRQHGSTRTKILARQ